MPKINLLDSTVYNHISAGEVVERPASVVKELVENSLDAGAGNINVEIAGGGIELIRVTDNGCGIEGDELSKAFLPHATSKISDISDLDGIRSLGFRGEALASIAAVSMLDMKSKIEDASVGGEIELEGGKVVRVGDAACPTGTQTTVRNLFFNTPARAKFLRKPKQEEAEITNLVARFILVNCNVGFRYAVDGKVIYQFNGTGLRDAVQAVYGLEAVKNLIPVEAKQGGLAVTGFVGRPGYSKPNRTYQTVSLNGRYIVNSTIAAAVHNVFSEYLMKRNYPFYVLHLVMPFSGVDVNVHPNKLDVRFENPGAVYALLHSAVGKAVSAYNHTQVESFGNLARQTERNYTGGVTFVQPDSSERTQPEPLPAMPPMPPSLRRPVLSLHDDNDAGFWSPAPSGGEAEPPDAQTSGTTNLSPPESPRIDAKGSREASGHEQQGFALPVSFRIIGQLFRTYILVESGEELLVIDQHAAHERLLYDRIVRDIDASSCDSQSLLIPYVFTGNPMEADFLRQQLTYLNAMGFGVEEFGSNAFRICAVPNVLSGLDPQQFIDDLIADMSTLKREKTSDNLRDLLAQKACKAAVKAGMALSEGEITRLLADMGEGSVLQCPHGRPVVYPVARREIEKWFKRIV